MSNLKDRESRRRASVIGSIIEQQPAEETMQTFRERGELDENGYCFYSTTEFVPESERALGYAMAGNTGDCDDPDAPEGAYEYSRCCIITLKEDGWHGEILGTGW